MTAPRCCSTPSARSSSPGTGAASPWSRAISAWRSTASGPTSGYARRVLAFGTWLVASDAAAVEAAVETLRARGTSFTLSLRTQTGRSIDAHGQAVAGRALLRLRETSQERCEIADLRATLDETRPRPVGAGRPARRDPQPVWRRNREGGLSWGQRRLRGGRGGGEPRGHVGPRHRAVRPSGPRAIARDEAARAAGLSRSVPRLSAVMAGSGACSTSSRPPWTAAASASPSTCPSWRASAPTCSVR